ncbi:MAG: hypothetical protein GY820_46580, partial [Gammaproteobacteria bacterium]|nr:hypothetical protein [Gammaproteobacteria bacterium]
MTDDRLSEIIGAFSSMQENLEEAFANRQAMRLVALTDQKCTTDHMYQFQKSDLTAFPLTQHSYWLPPSVEGTVQEIQEENANFWSEVQTLIISTMTNPNSEWYHGFRKAETDMGILLAMAALIGKACQAKGGIQVVLTLDERRRVWGSIDPRNESVIVTDMFHVGLHMPVYEGEHDDNLAAQLSDQMDVIMKGVNRISLPEDSTVEQPQEASSQGPNLFENLAQAFPTPNLPASTHSTPDTSLDPTACATAKVSSTTSAVPPATTVYDIDLGNVSSAEEGSRSGLASQTKA